MRKDKFYCPKCGKKQLIEDHEWTRGGYFRTWKCLHNQPTRRRYYSKATAPKGDPCGLVIKVEGRNAEIDDYGGVLGKLAQVNVPQIQQWLLKYDQDVHKRGLEILYQGPLVDVVRRRDKSGVGVGLYWRGRTWDEDPDILNPLNAPSLRARAASYVTHRGHAIGGLFNRNGTNVWHKDDDSRIFGARSYGKKLKADIVAWATSLEQALPGIIATCKSEDERWTIEQTQFSSTVRQLVMHSGQGGFRLADYSGHTKTALMQMPPISPQAALKIGQALGVSFRLALLSVNPHYVTPEEAIKIEAVLDRKIVVSISGDLRRRRFTLDEATEVAKILVANG
jgi:hypothetical protein